MKMNFDIQIPNPLNSFAEIEGTWKEGNEGKRYWNWHGIITAKEPIVAVSFMRVGNRIEWARSGKDLTKEIDVIFGLGTFDSDPKDVQTIFYVGGNGPRWRTLLDDDAKLPPEVFSPSKIVIGKPFSFCKPFGNPAIEFLGLIILREHVIGARNGL